MTKKTLRTNPAKNAKTRAIRAEALRRARAARTSSPRPKPSVRFTPLWVRWHVRMGKWTAEIRFRGLKVYLGLFTDLCDACVAVNVSLQMAGGLGSVWRRKLKRLPPGVLAARLLEAAEQTEMEGAAEQPEACGEDKNLEDNLLAALERCEAGREAEENAAIAAIAAQPKGEER